MRDVNNHNECRNVNVVNVVFCLSKQALSTLNIYFKELILQEQTQEQPKRINCRPRLLELREKEFIFNKIPFEAQNTNLIPFDAITLILNDRYYKTCDFHHM